MVISMCLDGPKMPMITGPKMAMAGDNVTLSCSASSNPLSVYKWFFNDSLVANTSEYVTPPLTMSMSGMYTCMAFNNITGKNSTAYTMLAVGETWMVNFYVSVKNKQGLETKCSFSFLSRSDSGCTNSSTNDSCHRRSVL